jgi:hypothetical protein
MNIIEDYWINKNNINDEEKPLIVSKLSEKPINYQYLEYLNEQDKRNANIFVRIFYKLFCCYNI